MKFKPLLFTNQSPSASGDELEGYFDWRNSDGRAGREHFRGTLKPNGELSLQGFQMDNGQGLATSRYHATLSTNGKSLLDGV